MQTGRYGFLVIGYGNPLRSDAAVGARVANTVASWQLPSVKSISAFRLTPELADEMSKVDYVLFVDACRNTNCARSVSVDPLVLGREISAYSTAHHRCSPYDLLRLSQSTYGYVPQAWLLQVPTESFAFGETLSSTATTGYDHALMAIENFLRTYQPVRAV